MSDWTRIARCLVDAKPCLALWEQDGWHPFAAGVRSPIHVGEAEMTGARQMPAFARQEVEFLVPLEPGKVIGVGLNYRSHAIEVGAPIPKNPLLFAKFNSSLVGHKAVIRVDEAITRAADWEVELAVVVGCTLRRASRREAEQAIFGYTVANDVTARDIQAADVQWTRSKCPDTFGPLGPWIVPPNAIDAGNCSLRARVNGVVMQEGNTSDLIFDVPELISFCSWNFTLEAGDVILTGTPPGVGGFRKPPIYLRHGDVVEVEVDGIGTLRNTVEVVTAGESGG